MNLEFDNGKDSKNPFLTTVTRFDKVIKWTNLKFCDASVVVHPWRLREFVNCVYTCVCKLISFFYIYNVLFCQLVGFFYGTIERGKKKNKEKINHRNKNIENTKKN